MIEIKQQSEDVGVFNAMVLHSKEGIEKLMQSVQERSFFILILDDQCIAQHELVRKMLVNACWDKYCSLAVIVNGEGTKNFKSKFHRSSSYVDQRMFPLQDFKKLFEHDQKIIEFFDYIQKEYGEIHVKGMRAMLLRA